MFFFQWISTSSDKEKGCVNNTKDLFVDYEEKKKLSHEGQMTKILNLKYQFAIETFKPMILIHKNSKQKSKTLNSNYNSNTNIHYINQTHKTIYNSNI